MIIKYDELGHSVIKIPENTYFEIKCKYDEGIFLILPDKEIQLFDIMNRWCFGRPNLSSDRVYDLYNEIVDVAADMLANNEQTVDLDAIEKSLMNRKYKDEWISHGYVDEDDCCWW